MALKIFISSVFTELRDERQALQEEIHKLQDLFVGMEFFGSDPNKPADYCVQRVKAADLYVGLFGNDFGSVDEASGMSFTQLEYETAAANHIPCLIYFKANLSAGGAEDERLTALKEKLRLKHIIGSFDSINNLKLRFLVDFISLLRGELFDKTIPVKRGAIPAEALLSLTQGLIHEQIKSVGQDKYISEVYVTREAEKEIARFTHFDEMFQARVETILQHLEASLAHCSLGNEAILAVSRARVALPSVNSANSRLVLEELRRAFHFVEVEEAVEALNSLIMEPSDGRFDIGFLELQSSLRAKPFVNQSRTSEIKGDILFERRRSLTLRALQTNRDYRQILRLFPSHFVDEEVHFANDLLKELGRLVELGLKRCLVLVDKAGTGKTNVACHVAEQLSREHPVVLLSGQIELSNEYDIERHIQQRFELAFSGIFTDWLNRVSTSLQATGKWLFIIIDGINENSKRNLFIQLLKGLLPRLEQRRIKIILSCRDLVWDAFRDTLEPYLFEGVVSLHEFNEAEWRRAVGAYFGLFNVECSLDKEAQEALRNPLLLRFFCEAHKNQSLGRISNLRLLSVFNLYVTRVGQSISEQHTSLKTDAVLNLLLRVAGSMWQQRSVSVNPAEIVGLGSAELDESSSAYNVVLSENIILEQARHTYSARKSVRFLYDEFMEYMIARTWVDLISDAENASVATSRLIEEAFESLSGFPSALGAVLFLDKMLDRHGAVVSEFIGRASKMDVSLLNSQQTSMVYAFESINFAEADDQLIAMVEKFEPTVRDDLKDRIAAVVLKILKTHPNHTYARKYVHQVLEVGGDAGAETPPSERLLDRPSPLTISETSPFQFPRVLWSISGPGVPVSPKSKFVGKKEKEKEEELPRLPPGRYHYSEDTKINAIGILVQGKDNKDYKLIEEGIRRLGRTDLHSALQALEYLDLAGDELVYKTVAKYMKASQPEYRIYCAWLLRKRYGGPPAMFLTKLLMDRETRVHQYTARIFESRHIERELIEETLRKLWKSSELTSWHLGHFISLLGMRQSFTPESLGDEYGGRIVEALENLMTYGQALTRLKVYRTIILYPSFINLPAIKERMRRDRDNYIRSLADKLSRTPDNSGI